MPSSTRRKIKYAQPKMFAKREQPKGYTFAISHDEFEALAYFLEYGLEKWVETLGDNVNEEEFERIKNCRAVVKALKDAAKQEKARLIKENTEWGHANREFAGKSKRQEPDYQI
jgi:hypothetical protein